MDGLLYAPLPQLAGEVKIVPGERVGTLRHLPQYIPTLVALDPATGQERWERPFPSEIRAAALGRDGFYLVCWDGAPVPPGSTGRLHPLEASPQIRRPGADPLARTG
jgi:hypothetical protein